MVKTIDFWATYDTSRQYDVLYLKLDVNMKYDNIFFKITSDMLTYFHRLVNTLCYDHETEFN